MMDSNSTQCRFILKTSELGSSVGELSCIQCTREPTSLQNTSSGLPSSSCGGMTHLPFSIYHDEEETSSARGQTVASSLPLTASGKSSI